MGIDMEKNIKLQALVDQWKEINAFINKLDTELWIVFTILGSIYGVVITAFEGNMTPVNYMDARFWLLIMLPIISAAIIGCLANSFRWVAIARMYASSIENEINDILGKENYIWNRYIVEDFVGKNNMHNAIVMPVIIPLFFSILCLYLLVSMFTSDFNCVIKSLYLLYTLALFIVSPLSFWQNGKIRTTQIKFDENNKYIRQ